MKKKIKAKGQKVESSEKFKLKETESLAPMQRDLVRNKEIDLEMEKRLKQNTRMINKPKEEESKGTMIMQERIQGRTKKAIPQTPLAKRHRSVSNKKSKKLVVPEEDEISPEKNEENWDKTSSSQSIQIYNKGICELMNELYYSKDETDEKIQQLLSDANKRMDKETANNVFISIHKNIKSYMQNKKLVLHKKMKELKILIPRKIIVSKKIRFRTRSNSLNCIGCHKRVPFPVFSRLNKSYYHLIPMSQAPKEYIEYLAYLCEIYKKVIDSTSSGIERICLWV